MNQQLKKVILRIIKENKGVTEWRVIKNKTIRNYWKKDKPIDAEKIIKHQLDLLEKEDKVSRQDQLPEIFYILMPLGYQEFDPWIKKIKNFILYDKNNLLGIIAIIISIFSLIISSTISSGV